MKFIHGGLPPELAYKVYTYQENGVRGSNVFADGREAQALASELEAGVFATGTDSLVLATLPLKADYAVTVPSADDSGLHPNAISVSARETVEAAGRSWETWVVSVQGGRGRQWISKRAPYLIRMEFREEEIVWALDEVLRDHEYYRYRPAPEKPQSFE